VSYPPEIELEVHEDHVHWRAFDLNAAGSALVVFAVDLYGWSLRNMSGAAAAVIDIYDGTDASGIPVFPLVIPANVTAEAWFGPNGVHMKNGVYANVTTGEIKGSILYKHLR
jgi:hypothetical protein